MKFRLKNIISLSLLFFCVGAFAQTQAPKDKGMPRVFMIGENETNYESLVVDCQSPLLSLCNNSIEEAYSKWVQMLVEMETYAEARQFDIKGLKLWINVFWNSDGTIRHIAYYPKPNSRNMDFEELSIFFYGFIDSYTLDLTHVSCFANYGSASFPTFSKYKKPAASPEK